MLTIEKAMVGFFYLEVFMYYNDYITVEYLDTKEVTVDENHCYSGKLQNGSAITAAFSVTEVMEGGKKNYSNSKMKAAAMASGDVHAAIARILETGDFTSEDVVTNYYLEKITECVDSAFKSTRYSTMTTKVSWHPEKPMLAKIYVRGVEAVVGGTPDLFVVMDDPNSKERTILVFDYKNAKEEDFSGWQMQLAVYCEALLSKFSDKKTWIRGIILTPEHVYNNVYWSYPNQLRSINGPMEHFMHKLAQLCDPVVVEKNEVLEEAVTEYKSLKEVEKKLNQEKAELCGDLNREIKVLQDRMRELEETKKAIECEKLGEDLASFELKNKEVTDKIKASVLNQDCDVFIVGNLLVQKTPKFRTAVDQHAVKLEAPRFVVTEPSGWDITIQENYKPLCKIKIAKSENVGGAQ